MIPEAVVFLLDAHPSMNAPYPSNTTTRSSTRLSCAKEAVEGMVHQLMIQSSQNEVGVIVLNTNGTHVKSEDGDLVQYPRHHMTELTTPSVTKPTLQLLQDIRNVMGSSSVYSGCDVIQGIIVAENALRQRTFKQQYRRRLVVFTDAEHKVETPKEVILRVVDKLRKLKCTLTVIGLDFEHSAHFEHPLPEEQAASKGESSNQEEDEGENDDSEITAGDDSDDDDDEESSLMAKRDGEQLCLISVVRLTGGSIIATTTMNQVADAVLGKHIPKSMKKSIDFHIAPGLMLDAKCSLLLSRASFPSRKQLAVQLDEEGKPRRDGNNEIMFHPVETRTNHWDRDDPDVEVTPENRTSAFRYGANFIPMSAVDYVGLQKVRSDPAIRILGYTDQSRVPRALMIGPPYAVSGDKSHRTCSAIAALCQALNRLQQVAICTYVKTKHSDPVLGALFPLQEEDASQPTRLFFMQLPFADDVRKFNMLPLQVSTEDSAEARACDNLIDSLMLPPDGLRSERIANPAIRSFHKTIENRAVDEQSTLIVSTREDDTLDPMSTPSEVLKRAASALETFCNTFPRQRVTEEDGNEKKKPRHWSEMDA